MENLAGVLDADKYIIKELTFADIPILEGEKSEGEVPYTITGKLGDWSFQRAWYYWVAKATKDKGLSLEVAAKLHEKEYLISRFNGPKTFGEVIRVIGHCGCPHPKEYAHHFDPEGNIVVLDPKGEIEKLNREFFETYPEMKDKSNMKDSIKYVKSLDEVIGLKSLIDSYHIDTQVALNEFAKAVRG